MIELRRFRWLMAAAAITLGLGGCATYSQQLQRAEGYYSEHDYDRALALFRHLDADRHSLSANERVRYFYLRGMTDLRLGYRTDARYWLGLSKVAAQKALGSLSEEELQRMQAALADLDAEVYQTEAAVEAPQQLGKECQWTSECDPGFICDDGFCLEAPSSGAPEEDRETPASEPHPESEAQPESPSQPALPSQPASQP